MQNKTYVKSRPALRGTDMVKQTNQEQMPYYLEKTGTVLWMLLHLSSPFPPLPLTLEFESTVFPPALDSPVKEMLC